MGISQVMNASRNMVIIFFYYLLVCLFNCLYIYLFSLVIYLTQLSTIILKCTFRGARLHQFINYF